MARPGNTWTFQPGANEVFDPIDVVHAGGSGVTKTASAIVGENAANAADMFSPGFASDHRLIVSSFNLSSASTAKLRTGANTHRTLRDQRSIVT